MTAMSRQMERPSSSTPGPIESVLLDDWYVVAAMETIARARCLKTRLFGVDIAVERLRGDACVVRRLDTDTEIASATRYGLVWASLGTPKQTIVDIAEAEEEGRHILAGGAFGVRVSSLRVIENFLDMGHLPFVHGGYLGAEPHTEITPYDVTVTDEGIVATKCRIFQPLASPVAKSGELVEYVFKVFRPNVAALYKTNPVQQHRNDVIGLFVQPVDEESCVAHSLLCYLKDGIAAASVRTFMQFIFSQDKPILENQLPRRLPLDPRAEMPVRADKSSMSYRNWLSVLDVRYGALPTASRTVAPS